jgi:hypothetical protein
VKETVFEKEMSAILIEAFELCQSGDYLMNMRK